MDKPEKISIKEAAAIANTGTVKQRCAAQRKRLRAKYGVSTSPTKNSRKSGKPIPYNAKQP